MDIHLLSQVPDDGSPFGVEYSTRRLTLDASGTVSCDDVSDALWQQMAAGILGASATPAEAFTPGDGARFLDRVPEYLRYHCVSPSTPLVYDHRGAWRTDNFRITWKPSRRLYWGHGYVFMCERPADRCTDGRGDMVPVAMLEGWGFFHDVGRLEGIAEGPGRPAARAVVVNLLPQRSAAWEETVLGASAGTRETKAFVRAFLRRFFDRCAIGIFPEAEGQFGPFTWTGGF
jgi:hypothetical protein